MMTSKSAEERKRNSLAEFSKAPGATQHQREEVRSNLASQTAEQLFQLADKDNNSTLDFVEFKRLHQIWRNTIEQDIRYEQEAAAKARRTRSRLSAAVCVSLVLTMFLAASCVINAYAVLRIVTDQVQTVAGDSGTGAVPLETRSGHDVTVTTAGREVPLGMLTFLPQFAPAEAMAAMPDFVTVQDPNSWGTMRGYKIESVSFSLPTTLTIHTLGGERIVLDGAAHGSLHVTTLNATDGSTTVERTEFCSACSTVQLKSVPSSSHGLQAAIAAYNQAASLLTDDELHLCATDMQVGRLLGLQTAQGFNVDVRSLAPMPAVCSLPENSTELEGDANYTEAVVYSTRRSLQDGTDELDLQEAGDGAEGVPALGTSPARRRLKHKDSKSKSKSKESKSGKSKDSKESKHNSNKGKKSKYVCLSQKDNYHMIKSQFGKHSPQRDQASTNYKNCKAITGEPHKINFYLLDQNDDNCIDLSELLAYGIFEAWASDSCGLGTTIDETDEILTTWSCCSFHTFAESAPSEHDDCPASWDPDVTLEPPGGFSPFCQPRDCLSETEFNLMLGDTTRFVALWRMWRQTQDGSVRWAQIVRSGGLDVPSLSDAYALCGEVGITAGRRLEGELPEGAELPSLPGLTSDATAEEHRQNVRELAHSPYCPNPAAMGSLYGSDGYCNVYDVNAAQVDPDCINGGCHPSSTLLTTAEGSAVRIDELTVGTLIQTAAGIEPITALMHAEPGKKSQYFRFHTANASMAITDGHWLFVNGVERDPSTVKVGELLTTLCCGEQPVTKIEATVEQGLFHITTPSNTYYADGVLSSTYVDFVPLNVWKVAGGLYPQLRYLTGLPITPEGHGPLSIFWPLYVYQALGLPQAVVDALWPLTMTATLVAELGNTLLVQAPVSAAVIAASALVSLRQVACK